MTRSQIIVFLLLFTAVGVAQKPIPQLPQTYIDTTFTPPNGVTWSAHTSTDFQSALNSANPGDTIVLDSGSTYLGNFTLPAKGNPNNEWIYIIPSAYSSLPAPGNRVSPGDAVNMPKIVTPFSGPPITVDAGANHYRLVGLEVSSNSSFCPNGRCLSYELIYAAMTPSTSANDSITVDRCYIHGSPTIDTQHAIVANASNFAVVDSYVSEIHAPHVDTQAVGAWYSPGPIKIVNNFLEAATENIMFGGAGNTSNPFVAADIEIRNNYLYKPMSWAQVGVSIPPNNIMVVKNLLELKSAKRVLIDSNTLENVWVGGQTGFALMLTPRTSDSGNLAVVDDVTISNNVLKNVSSGFNVTEFDNLCDPTKGCTSPGESKRVVFYNNLFLLGDTTQAGYTTGYAFGGLINNQVTDFVVQHNTVVAPPNLGYCKGSVNFNVPAPFNPPVSRTHNIWILDNAFCRQINGRGGIVGQFSYILNAYMGDPSPVNPRLLGNVFYAPSGDRVYPLPPHNYTSTLPFVYVNPDGGNYQLSVPAWTDTSDGQIAGVNSSTLP
jgi:hypothetical protein